ncbi:Protease HtpX-like protein 2, partial [Bienertia sinuspersici]
EIVVILCELEMFFPPSFFDVMIHLTIHLVREVRFCGPVHGRNQYAFERQMKTYKGYVKNPFRPEACITERLFYEEVIGFSTEYLGKSLTIGLPLSRHSGRMEGQGTIGHRIRDLKYEEWHMAHTYILFNEEEVAPYADQHIAYLRKQHRKASQKSILDEHTKSFSTWLKNQVLGHSKDSSHQVSSRLRSLAFGPEFSASFYSGYVINGCTFYTRSQDKISTMQNSGVSVEASAMHFASSKDKRPVYGKIRYYGVIEEICELVYSGFTIPVFKCIWVDNNTGVEHDALSGSTIVNFDKEGHKEDPYILANQVKQVFYMTDPTDKKKSIVITPRSRHAHDEYDDDIESDEEEEEDCSNDLAQVQYIIDDSFDDQSTYVRDDHEEGMWVEGTSNDNVSRKRTSHSEDDASDPEKAKREDERGRTILAMVGKAIQGGTRIPLDWHPIYKTPSGTHRKTFCRYIGVVVRERVCVTYVEWTDVPNELKEQLYDAITKGFTVLESRKKWVLTRAATRRRAFKTFLRKWWLYRKNGSIRRSAPWKYPWISQIVWDKFIQLCTSENFKRTEFEKQGISVTLVPRYLTWLKAHSRAEDGNIIFDNPIDLAVADAIVTAYSYHLKTLEVQCKSGEVVIEGRRDDILARALKKPEQGGHVFGVGSGVTMREYFGSSNPTPPSELRAEINRLQAQVQAMQDRQNQMMSLMMTYLSEDQVTQFFTSVGNGKLGENGGQLVGGDGQMGGNGGQRLNGVKSTCSTSVGYEGVLFTQLLTGGAFKSGGQLSEGDIDSQVPSKPPLSQQQIEPYRVPWPENKDVNQEEPAFPDIELHSSGWNDCCLALEVNKELEIVTLGRVYIPEESEVIVLDGKPVPHDTRQVDVIHDIVPTALLPCPMGELTFVCQAKDSYIAWPSHLILPKM